MADELRAYTVQEEDEGTGGIVFAKHAIVALREGARIFGDGDIDYYKARRAPWADAYAPGPVPPLVMIDNGWWFNCAYCDTRITSDNIAYDLNDEERPLYPVEVGENVYCSGRCLTLFRAQRIAKKAAESAAIAEMESELLAKFPGVTVHGKSHAYCPRDETGRHVAAQVIVYFRFPGCTVGPGAYRFDTDNLRNGRKPGDRYATICNGDLPAWEAWRSAKAIEAGTAETAGLGAQHESAAREAHSLKSPDGEGEDGR